jgi:predicted PurR-regulated permease PerM
MSLSAWTRALVISATIILVGLIVFGIAWLLARIGSIVLLLLLASLVTVLLMPVVDGLTRLRHMPRPLAVVIAYLVVAILFASVLYAVIPPLVQQGDQLVQVLPGYFQSLTAPGSPLTDAMARFGINPTASGLGNLGTQAQQVAQAVLSNIATVVRDITTVAVGIVVVLVISFYLLNEGHEFRAKLDKLIPRDHRGTSDFLTDSAINAVAGYVRAQLLVALMVGVLAGFAAWLIGVRFPLIIGLLAGVLELIPFFGPTLGAIPAVLIATFQGPWVRVGLIIVAFIVIQQIESNIVGPRIMARGVGLHPLVVIVAVLIGIEVAGIWGALFAVPGAAILVAVGRRVYRMNRDRIEQTSARRAA